MHGGGGRGKQRGPTYSSTGRSSGKGQQKAAPECEQFPELHEEDATEPAAAIQEPPPYYSALGENSGSGSRAGRGGGAKAPVFTIGDEGEESVGGGGYREEGARPQIVTTYSAAPRVHQAAAADDARYYQPASFPGYTVVQLINSSGDGGEGQALLARGGGRRHSRQQQGSCVGRCCGHICRCLCFILGAVVLACLLCGATFLARQIIGSGGGSADWRCHGLLQHSDQHFSFNPQQHQQQLVIESVEGVTQTNVHFVNGAWGVRAVVEASAGRILGVGVEHTDSALRVLGNGPSSRWPWWQVRGGCVRATLFIGIPPANTTTTNSRLPSLEVSTGTGTVVADGVGPLAVSNLKLSLRNGSVQLHDFGVSGTLLVSTSNGPINATRVHAGMTVDLISSNGNIGLDDVSAPNAVTAYASNAAVRARHVRAAYGVLQTSNGKVSLSDVHVSDKLILRTSNAAVDGDAAAEFVYARTSNGPINLKLSGGGGEGRRGVLHYVTLDTTNGAISLAATDFRGTFDVHTSNSRVAVGREVESGSVPLSFTSSSTTHKTGVYGDDANTGNITLSATNARATLNFY
ncbi:hypothetical protein GGI00_000690 [Coemansia sp. RSA 2681]|nr:hypothetical protein GGI00_000690 [Coemansia sp. RSA 2681]